MAENSRQVARSWAERAIVARRAGDWAAAVSAWEVAIEFGPQWPNWRLFAVEAAARAGLTAKALTWFRSIPADSAASGDAALSAAAALIELGKLDEAVVLLEMGAPSDDSQPLRVALSACQKLASGDVEEAWRLAAQAKRLPDPSRKAMRALVRCGLSGDRVLAVGVPKASGRPVRVDEHLGARTALFTSRLTDLYAAIDIPAEVRPTTPPPSPHGRASSAATAALVMGAQKMASDGDIAGALAQLEAGFENFPSSPQIALALAKLLTAADQHEAAYRWYCLAVEADPWLYPTRLDFARWLMRSGQLERALPEWLILYGQSIARAEPLIQICRCLQKLEWYALARDAYQLLSEQQPQSAEARLGRARALHTLGDMRAVDAWRAVLSNDPASEEAGYALLRLLTAAGERKSALGVLEDLIALRPESGLLRVEMARLLIADQQVGAAVEVLQALCEEHPDSIGHHLELARAATSTSDHALAASAWRRCVAISPTHAEALRSLADSLEKLGHADEALEDWEPWIWLARLYHRRNEPERAAAAYLRAAQVAPEDVRVLAEAARYMGKSRETLQEAESLANRWVNKAPLAVDPLMFRSSLRHSQKRLKEAEADLESALLLDPMSVVALATKARRLYAEQRWQEARPVAETWREATSKGADATDLLARVLTQMGMNEEAAALYRDQLVSNPRDVGAIMAVAGSLARERKLDEAIALWRQALAVDPRQYAAWTELVSALANADRESEALAEYANARASLGQSAEALYAYASMLDRAEFIELADAAYRAAVEADPCSANVLRAYGRYLARHGRFSAALKVLAAARENSPSDWALALELIDVIETLEFVGHPDPTAVMQGPDLGPLIPEQLFKATVVSAAEAPTYQVIPRRVVLVTSSLAAGGAERQVAATATGLSQHEQIESVHVCCQSLDHRLGRDFYASAIREARVPIHHLTEEQLEQAWSDPVVMANREILRRLPADMGPVAWWVSEFRRLRPEVVHAWQDMTCLAVSIAAALAGVPKVLLGTRSVRPDNPRRRLRRWMQRAYRQMLQLPNVHMLNNSVAGAADYAEWLGITPQSIQVVYNGLEFEALRQEAEGGARFAVRQALGIPMEAVVVGGVFRMSEEKRPLLWMETAWKVAKRRLDAHFVVCGEGRFLQKMIEFARLNGFSDRVHFPGLQAHIGRWFAAMDAVLLTSRHEGLPNVLLEAQSLGLGVVVPRVGGAAEVLMEGITGFAIPEATADQMSDKLLMIIEDCHWREAVRRRAPEFVAGRFSIQAMVAATLQAYFPALSPGAALPLRQHGSAVLPGSTRHQIGRSALADT
jgi:tetratricopeptide (TPR) repeat protein/glycosyltransferase involved in cell wall biosynthesis